MDDIQKRSEDIFDSIDLTNENAARSEEREENEVTPKKKKIGMLGIEYGPPPEEFEDEGIATMTASAMAALAIDWLLEANAMRGTSNFQGKISEDMKARMNKAIVITRLLLAKAEEKGDASFWQMKYERTVVDSKVKDKKIEHITKSHDELNSAYDSILEEIDVLEKERIGLQERIVQLEKAINMSSWEEDINQETKTKYKDVNASTSKKKDGGKKDGRAVSSDPSDGDVVMRPAILGVRKPLTESRLPKDRVDILVEEVLKMGEDIRSMRREMDLGKRRCGMQPKEVKPEEWPLLAPPGPFKTKKEVRITNNVQLVPPRSGPTGTEKQKEKWLVTVKGGKVRKAQGENPAEGKTTLKTPYPEKDRSKSKSKEEEATNNRSRIKDKEGFLRRAPRTAAITIKSEQPNFSYAGALKIDREKIDLSTLGIENSRIKKASNGGIIIEILGKDGTEKADNLMTKLQEVMKEGKIEATVKRPSIKGELRIYGFDESVSEEDIRKEICKMGSCLNKDVEVGKIRQSFNQFYSVWAHCPLAAAIQTAAGEKFRVGWTFVKVELLKARPVQCFKCWQYGHVRGSCTAQTDYSDACFNCGKSGHALVSCRAKPHCVVCEGKGMNPEHMISSNLCGAIKNTNQIAKGTEQKQSDRRIEAETMDTTNDD